jgi:hypothetical protein
MKIKVKVKGGEDPPKKNVYTSQKDIDRDNAFVKDFLTRHGDPNASRMVVARDIGDAIPKFITPDGRPAIVNKPILQTVLPLGVSINDVFQTKEGQYGYYHPQQGTFIQVDPQAIYSRYGGKK